jgi:hypothetical protein
MTDVLVVDPGFASPPFDGFAIFGSLAAIASLE